MHKTRFLLLLLTLALILSAAGAAQADGALMTAGKVLDNFYQTPEGLSFTIPSGFEYVKHKTDNPDSLRIVLNSPDEGNREKTHIVIDVFTGRDDVTKYMGDQYLASLNETAFVHSAIRDAHIIDGYLLHEDVQDVFGEPALESLLVLRASHRQTPFTCFCYGFCWSTDNYFVRVCYFSRAIRRSLPEDIPKFLRLYYSMIVP